MFQYTGRSMEYLTDVVEFRNTILNALPKLLLVLGVLLNLQKRRCSSMLGVAQTPRYLALT